MTDFVSLRAAGRRIDFSTSTRDAARVKDWDWGNTTQAPTMAAGVDGGVPVPGTSALEGDRGISLDVQSTYGNVTGDADGLAINRAVNDDGSAWSETTGSGTLTVSRAVDITGLASATVEVGCEVVCSTSTTVTVELVRGSTVVASTTRTAVAGQLLVIREEDLAITGSSTATIRVKITAAPASTTLKARRFLVGVGLDGVYHDQYTPGAELVDGRAVRVAAGERWANVFLAAIDRAVGAVRRGGAELRRSGDGFDEEYWAFDINAAEYTAPQTGDHHRGHADAKIIGKARQLARLAPRDLAGHTELVGPMPVFVADEPIPGSDDALGDITVTWNGSRRDAHVAVCEALPMAYDPASAVPAWTSITVDDTFAATVLTGPLPVVAPAVVATYVSTFTGRARFAQRIWTESATTASLIVNGRKVASVDVSPSFYEQDGKWRIVDFLVQSVAAGDKIGLALQAAEGVGFVDQLIVTPDEYTAALMTIGDPVLPSDQAAGHDFRAGLTDGTNIDGTTALLGGTLAAPNWKYDTLGFAKRTTGSATDALSTSATFTLGTVDHVSVDFRVSSISAFSGSGMIGLFATSGDQKVYATAVTVGSREQLNFVVDDGVGSAFEVVAPTIDAGFGAVVDGRIQIDDTGRVTFLAASGGAKLRVVGAAHVPALAGGTYRASAFSPTATRLRVYSLRLLAGDSPYDEEVRWAPGTSGRLVEGRMPRLRAGSLPYVFAHSAFTSGDSPVDANVHPTSYSVSITPRVLTVPD